MADQFTGLLGDVLGYMQDPNRTQALQGIGGLLQGSLSQMQESQKKWRDLNARAFGDKKNPAKVTDQAAFEELTNMTMAGPMGVAPVGMIAKAPQQSALALAQKRAALPIEQGGLGLPANNTPDMRAAAMGFDVSNPQYHATDVDFASINPSSRGKMGAGIYTSPDVQYAEKYAALENRRVLPLVSKGYYADADKRSAIFDKVREEVYANNPNVTSRELHDLVAKEMQNRGYSGFDVDKERLTFNPSDLRSRFAAFDPFRRDVATATAMGVALPDLLAAELPEEELKRNQSAGLLFP